MPDSKLHASLLALFEHGHDAMFIADERGLFTRVNDAFLRLYNYTADDVIGQPIGMIKSNLHSDDFYRGIQETLDREGNWSGEIRNSSYAGEIIHVWTRIIKTGEGYVGVQVDLSERDRAARQVEQSARLESISTLAGGIAHEFNNILAGLQGHLHMIKRAIPEDNAREKERMIRIGNLIQRASGLVQNMLVFSKQKRTVNSEVSLAALLEDVVKLVRPSIPKLISLDLKIEKRGLISLANEIQLKQTLFELISNAGSAFDKMDEATLPSAPLITVGLDQKDAGSAVITIRDNGYGMNAHDLKHCMDPFFTTKPVGQGTGLGLSSANSYIKQLGGELEIDSMPLKGTRLTISMPLIRASTRVEPLGRTILLADDDEAIRLSLHEILAGSGYEVLDAANGIEALDLWHQHENKIDAVVMDIVMPQMDGMEVAGKIRETGSTIPVCMMTGYSNQSVSAELKVHLLRKPVDPSLILQYLERRLTTIP